MSLSPSVSHPVALDEPVEELTLVLSTDLAGEPHDVGESIRRSSGSELAIHRLHQPAGMLPKFGLHLLVHGVDCREDHIVFAW